MTAIVETEQSPHFDSLRYVINDFLECTGLTISSMEIEEIAAIDSAAAASNPNIRIAVVATSPEVIAAADAYANDPFTAYTTRIFGTMDEAKSWLRLPTA